MESIGQYIGSIVAAAVACSIVTRMIHRGTARELVKLICGVFLAFSLIHPITVLRDYDFAKYTSFYNQEAEDAAAAGQNLSRKQQADIIKQETEAYILDKAAALNAELEVDVQISEEDTPVPVSARLSGSISPYAKQQLEKMLTQDLGITKENQTWIG